MNIGENQMSLQLKLELLWNFFIGKFKDKIKLTDPIKIFKIREVFVRNINDALKEDYPKDFEIYNTYVAIVFKNCDDADNIKKYDEKLEWVRSRFEFAQCLSDPATKILEKYIDIITQLYIL